MRKHLLSLTVIIFLLFSTLVWAEDNAQTKYYYVGSISGNLPMQMELSLDGTELRGSYYYDSKGIPLSLLGEVNLKESTIKLSEIGDKKKKTGEFNGTFTSIPEGMGLTIEGTWSSPDGNTKLPFKLTKVANYAFSVIKQGKYSEAKWSYPLLISKNEVIQNISTKLKDSMKPQIDEYQKDAKEGFMSDLITSTWLFTYDYSIEYYSDELLSFTGLVYSYTGGAHGNTYFVSSNYWINNEDSKLLKMADLFKKETNYVKVISDLIVKDLKKQKAGWVVDGEITSLKEDEIGPFALSPRGIQFAFAPYAVGPYSDGAFFITIAYEDLKDIIDAEGPLSQFIVSSDTESQ
ncbi:MAG: DUF3298 and DUF4163 domain-containing protein [Thermodesulfobacteriota bacterium]